MSRYLCVILLATVCSAAGPGDFFTAIRANDISALKKLIQDRRSAVNEADARGTTPLHYAATFGSVDALKLLLDAGADVKARNNVDATALILGAHSAERVHLLLAAGSDAKAVTKFGRTALTIAAGRAGMAGAVKELLDRGAEIEQADVMGFTALNLAAANGNTQTVRLLLDRGANPKTANKGNFTALINAVTSNDLESVRLLLAAGADPNAAITFSGKVKHGDIGFTKGTALITAAPYGSVEMVRTLLKAGAKVNVKDDRGMTPLTAAVASDTQDASVVRELLAAGADPNATDTLGATVLDWARRTNDPAVVKLLEAAGAKSTALKPEPVRTLPPLDARKAVTQAVALLETSASTFFKESGCVACHHQPIAAQAYAAAKAASINVPETILEDQKIGLATLRPIEPSLLLFMDPGGEVDSVATTTLGFASTGLEPNGLTDAAVHYVAGKQGPNGGWESYGVARAPAEVSNITRTVLAIRLLKQYGWPARAPEFEQRITSARGWLLRAEARTSPERADLLIGLKLSGASRSDIKRVADALVKEQRSSGGWAQNPHMAPDAYATGVVLSALVESGSTRATDPLYKRGVDYLLRTQLDDGSWYVRSRSPKFQPYFQSGFPHDHDQWISAFATGHAATALAHSVGSTVAGTRTNK